MLYGEMAAAEDLNSYTITSTIPGVNTTSITVDTSGLTFDWADVTLEVYDVDECLKFPKVGSALLRFLDCNTGHSSVRSSGRASPLLPCAHPHHHTTQHDLDRPPCRAGFGCVRRHDHPGRGGPEPHP